MTEKDLILGKDNKRRFIAGFVFLKLFLNNFLLFGLLKIRKKKN